ncbi:DUF2586 family protein [Tenacibaculum maritimum]|uniref:DUF2586 family protein n=1 Tax=Tenacibaculum maritimum TaxID=107401 RepID=UPI0012E43A3B|nr:DUF2586 family protein [Tenacibaculum maritimum]CAA0158531.1 conserved hypothetical protein [Tenacibaculum maritimum]CAA0222554.1 conserved hypothetical protein [Tenacibaculum maritimum]
MANLNAVNIKKGEVGQDTLGTSDAISGLIVGAVAPTSLALDEVKSITTLKQAENLGITQAYDDSNRVNVYRHISEFFRNARQGTELHLMLVDRATSMSNMCEVKGKILLASAKGKIKQLAIATNLEELKTPTMLDGIAKIVHDAIPKGQLLADWAYQFNMPCQVFIEGLAFGGNSAAALNLRDIPNLKAPKVSVFIGQDYTYAKTRTGLAKKYADVGTLLGICSKARVNQDVGNNELFNLTEETTKTWIEPGLSSNVKNDAVFEDLQPLEDKGYLFGIEYSGIAGVRINNDHTCTPIIVDNNNSTNEHTIAYGRVHDKAVRLLRSAYLPKVKTDWSVDPKTGKLRPGVVVALEDVGDKIFEDMIRRGEISYGKATVGKDSDLLIEKKLQVSYKIVPKGNIDEIAGIINLKTKS